MAHSTDEANRQYPMISDVRSARDNWGWLVALGIFLVILGAIAIGASVYTTFFTILFLGATLVLAGIAQLIYSFWVKKWSGFFFSLLTGLLYLIMGGMFLWRPLQAAAALTLLIGSFFVVSGVFRIVTALYNRFDQWGWVVFSGAISLILGLLILEEWPLTSLWVIGLFVGIDLIIYGWTCTLIGLVARKIKV